MKFWKKLGIALVCALIMFSVYYISYRFYQNQYGNKDKEKFAKQLSNKIIEVNTAEENTITQYTKLTIENYNRIDGEMEEETIAMPVEYIGKTREELLEYLTEYEKSPDLPDVEAGFEKYQIMSFSSSHVVLRKIFAPSKIEYKYYLLEENGCVTVYYIDKKTVFEYTNILVENLPDDVRVQVRFGKYITNEDSLYDFLETYTS